MKKPLREISRPKALAVAAIVAGAVAVSGAAAALNVGLLTGHETRPFDPQLSDVPAPAAEGTVDVVYQDVPATTPESSDDSPAQAVTGADPVAIDHDDDAADEEHERQEREDSEHEDSEHEDSDFDD